MFFGMIKRCFVTSICYKNLTKQAEKTHKNVLIFRYENIYKNYNGFFITHLGLILQLKPSKNEIK